MIGQGPIGVVLERFVYVLVAFALIIAGHGTLSESTTEVRQATLNASKVASFNPANFWTDGRVVQQPLVYVNSAGKKVT